jgi:hypothetical protein
MTRTPKADAAEPAVPGEGGALRDLLTMDDAQYICPACCAAERCAAQKNKDHEHLCFRDVRHYGFIVIPAFGASPNISGA